MRGEVRPLPKFEYCAPESLTEVLRLLQEHGDGASVLAGGTDLLLNMKLRTVSPRIVVDVNKVPELSFIELRENNLHIGATTRLNAVKASQLVREKAPALAEAIGYLASQVIRNRATIGGNLCSASRAADTAPPLLALDTTVRLQSLDGERRVALSEFFIGPGRTVREPNEILREVIIPCRGGRSTFLALGNRKGFMCSIASVAVSVMVSDGAFAEVRVALGAVNPIPMRSRRLEERLTGMAVSEESITAVLPLLQEELHPITDIQASAAYRRDMARVLTKRALAKVALGEDACW
jgi:carbon-monoxide dehydrogenase medium subunit